ncbi:MAG: HDOD domain-containing protein [Phycisphaerales bacterium]|nr:HDOD domain-containing protein [Phycisphaerales bacterium]
MGKRDQDHTDQRTRQVELVLEQMDQLPTLSPIAQRVLNLGSAAEADLQDIVRIIQSDPALTARILSMCQRAEHGLGDRVTTVDRAVVMLGFEAVRAAILSVAVYDAMTHHAAQLEGRDGAEGFRHDGFWRHCVAVACAADEIARAHPSLKVSPDEAFVAGLLHDLGKLALELVLPRTYGKVMKLAEERGLTSSNAAHRIIGIDHHVAGKRLAEHWNLPLQIQDAMWLYGQPPEGMAELRNKAIVGVVSVAHNLARSLHLGWSGEGGPVPSLDRIAEHYGVDAEKLHTIGLTLHETVTSRCSDLGLESANDPSLLFDSIAQANAWLGRAHGRLEKQAEVARSCQHTLEAISSFYADQAKGRGLVSAIGAASRSATALLEPRTIAALVKYSAGDPWRLNWISPGGETFSTAPLPEPEEAGNVVRSLADTAAHLDVALEDSALAPWLGETWRNKAGSDSAARVVPLTPGRIDDAPVVVLIHDGASAQPHQEALVGAWSAAVAAAARHDSARRLGERLAEANRALSAAQDRLAEADAMARLGQMAAGAAHEMNNPLTVISGRAQLMLETAAEESVLSAASAIVDNSHRLSDLITTLHVFADPPTPEAQDVQLESVVRAMAQIARDRLGSGLDLSTDLSGAPADVRLDQGLVSRILAELVVNAAETGSPVSLVARIDTMDEGLVFEVVDQGPGLSEHATSRAFDPFFSEKPAGRQPGLGLARARKLAELLNGTLTLANGRTAGAIATLSLPAWKRSKSINNIDLGISQHPEAVG